MENQFNIDPFIELLGFKICQWDNGCDYCNTPENGSYIKSSGCYEYPDEIDYEICGKCIINNQIRNKGKFNERDLPKIILPF